MANLVRSSSEIFVFTMVVSAWFQLSYIAKFHLLDIINKKFLRMS